MKENEQMRVVLTSDVFKTTQEHKCWGCGNKIPSSNKVLGTIVHDEDMDWTCYWCEVCREYLIRHKPDLRYSDGISFRGVIKTDPEGWAKISKAIAHIKKTEKNC